jgi:hypothetical protein
MEDYTVKLMTLTLAMSEDEWKELRAQLPYKFPAVKMKNAITDILTAPQKNPDHEIIKEVREYWGNVRKMKTRPGTSRPQGGGGKRE